jgi:hypothetical protein
MRIATCCLASATLLACGTDSPSSPGGGDDGGQDILPTLNVPPKPDNGIQIITPIFHNIGPSSDNEVCTWTDVVMDKTTDVRKTQAFQSEPGGHHVVIYYTNVKQPPGTQRICNDTDMATFRLLAAGGEGTINEAPGNLVYRIPAGAQIVLNHHYLNATDQTFDGQSGVNINFADPGNWTPSGNVAIVDTSLDVKQGAYTEKIHCDFDRDFKFWYLIPHMHQWGVEEKINLTQNGVVTQLFDTIWDPGYAFHPPAKLADPSAPFVVHAGDSVDIECDYVNNTGMDLPFGFEMCVMFGQFVDDNNTGGRACDQGNWLSF